MGFMRQQHSWNVISRNSILSRATASQKTQLQAVLQLQTHTVDTVLWRAGDVGRGCYLVDTGSLVLEFPGGERTFGPGAFVCEMAALEAHLRDGAEPELRHVSSLRVASGAAEVCFITGEDILGYMERNPGMRVCLFDELWLE
eukprot:Amastigsp_a176694_6.p2 type:complete len:143 gc:universal Amastigsp_a176694_6:1-429(+)